MKNFIVGLILGLIAAANRDPARVKEPEAFDVTREDPRTRDAYGPGLGQQMLTARRLCECSAEEGLPDAGGSEHDHVLLCAHPLTRGE